MWRFLKTLEIELPNNPLIPLLGLHTEESRIERDTCTSFWYFYWSIIVLQCCIHFCCTMKWISHMSTHTHSLLDFLPHPAILPLSVITEHGAELPALCRSFLPVIYFTYSSVYFSILISSVCPTLPFLPTLAVSTCPFSTSTSLV